MSYSDRQKEFRDNYRYAHDYWGGFGSNAQVYTRAAAGNTWSHEERQALEKEGREPMELNIMRRPLQFFSGYLRDNINQIVYSGIEGSDEQTAEQFTKVGYQIWNKNKGYSSFLNAADEAMKSAISLCGIRMDYSRDFINGDAVFFSRTFNSFYLDPTFESIDLSDAGFAITRDLIGRAAVKQLLKEIVDPKIVDEVPAGFNDDKFLQAHPQFTTLARNRNLLSYDQYYTRTTRPREYIIDRDTGFTRDITDESPEDKRNLKNGVKRLQDDRAQADQLGLDLVEFPNVEVRKVERPYIEMHVLLNGQCVYTGEDETGLVETFPFVPILCYFEPAIWEGTYRLQGMAAAQYSNQRQFNKRHMKIVDMMDTQISTGYKYFIGSVPDVTDLQQSGQNRLIGVSPDPEKAPAGLGSVEQLVSAGVDPSIIQYQEILDNLSLTLGNVTQASLGMDEKRNTLVSGRLAQVQIAQNLTSNRKVFDQIEEAQLELGRKLLLVIQRRYPPEKIKRMLNEEPTEQFYSQDFEQYDAAIKEGVRSRSQQDAYYYELVNLKREGIVDVPQTAIVDALSMTGITDLKEQIEAQSQAAAQQQAKVDEQERMALELMNAQKEQSLALAQERRGRVVADLGLAAERASEAEENRSQAALARAKTITEIASMEDERIMRVLNFVHMLNIEEKRDRQEVQAEITAMTDQINAETEGTQENQQLNAAAQALNNEAINGLH